jgi:hypothetical protein
MRGTAKGLPRGAVAVREDLDDEDSDHRSLSPSMRRDERKNAKRYDDEMLYVESP